MEVFCIESEKELECFSVEPKELKKLEANWGMPQDTQCQDKLSFPKAVYVTVFILMQSAWYQPSQSSHWIALFFHVHALLHTIHGHFGVLGPGFVSMSPARKISNLIRLACLAMGREVLAQVER